METADQETLEEVDKLETEIKDRVIIQDETKDLNRRIHDQKPASEILQMPYGEGSSNSKNEETFRVYYSSCFNKTVTMAGIGVAICDSKDEMIYELRKPLDLSEFDIVSRRSVEEQVLIEALNAAIALDLKRIVFYCDYYPLYQFVSGQWRPKQQKLINLLDQVNLLRKNFTYCEPSFIAHKDVKFAFKLAREAISSEINDAASSQEKLENCVICLDDKSVDQFFSTEGCTHQFCYSCIKQHVEVKLLNGVLPKCPHEGCGNDLRIESCEKFLNPTFTEMMRQRVKEESIPVTEKVYCPYPKCSALMSKTKVFKLPRMINEDGAITCYKCRGNFCVNCRVPWHNDMNCEEYKRRNPTLIVEESKFKSLAERNLWRQCVKCQHMIELAAGCYHMTCRCGYEFCYTCGAEWKNKKATCTCPLWHEENILDNEEDEDEDDGFEHNFVLQNVNFGHNVVLEDDDDFGHNVVHEEDDFGHNVLEDDDFGHNVVREEDDFGHNVLEDDDFGGDVVHEDDGFGHNVVLEDDVFEDDGFGHNVVIEDDVFEDDGFGHNVVLEDDVFEDDGLGHNVVIKDDVFEDDDFGHDVVLEGDDFEDDNIHENDDFVEEVLFDDDVDEDDNLEDDDVHENDDFEDDVIEEQEQEQEDGGNDFEDDVYDDFGGDADVYDDFGGDEDVYDDFGDVGDVYDDDDDYYF